MNTTLSQLLIVLALSSFIIACGGEEPLSQTEQKDMLSMIDSASAFLESSKKFTHLLTPNLPEVKPPVDSYRTEDNEFRFVDSGIVASHDGSTGRVLFDVGSGEEDAKTQHAILVTLHREDSVWHGEQVYFKTESD